MDGRQRARVVRALGAVTLILCLAPGMRAQRLVPVQGEERAKDLSAGRILVARRSLQDPNFAQTVILLVQHSDDDGTVGLILNRQTKIPLSKLANELEGAKGRTDPLYLGGPVQTEGVMALLRARTKPDDAKRVTADIYVISNKAGLEKSMAGSSAPNTLRLYLGYAGWDSGQLEWELGQDAWNVLPANPALVFDPHPDTLWSRLIEQEDLQMASIVTSALEALRYL